MSSIKPSHLLIVAAVAFALGGCGSTNDRAVTSEHPADWATTHKNTASKNIEACVECHGANLDGGISNVSCVKCHPNGNLASGCSSCHGAPPDGPANGTANRNLSHSAHSNVSDITCSACHNTFGYGTPGHGTLTSARLSLDPAFKAKTAAADPAYTPSSSGVTCSNVSCHGGQTTPVWGAAITDCKSCHQQGVAYQDPEYNSYYSGYSVSGLTDALGARLGTDLATNQHARHLAEYGATCKACHSMTKLTKLQHFGGLVSKTFTSPGNSIGGGDTRIGSYNTTSQTCSNVSCHTLAPANNVSWIRLAD